MLVTYVVVTLAAHGNDDTLMTITHTALTADLREQHVGGWRLIAEQLDTSLLRKRTRSA